MADEKISQVHEIWKPVVGFEGRYEVSSLGRLRSLDHVTISSSGHQRLFSGRELNPPTYENGYVVATLTKDKEPLRKGLHVVVLEAFRGPRPHGCHGAHGNGIRNDNRLENLRWATFPENENDKLNHGTDLRGEKHHQVKLSKNDVEEIRFRFSQGESAARIWRSYPYVTRSCIHKITTRKIWAWMP